MYYYIITNYHDNNDTFREKKISTTLPKNNFVKLKQADINVERQRFSVIVTAFSRESEGRQAWPSGRALDL